MFTRYQRGPMLRTAPTGEPVGDPGTGAPPAPPTPAVPAPPVTPAAPAAFDPSSLPPEARAYLDGQTRKAQADADAKARLTAKENARKELFEEFARAAGIAPEATDPTKLAEQLTRQQGENRQLKINAAVGTACRAAEIAADETLVTAVLQYSGRLADLDPAAPDFADKVRALVQAEVAANPRLKVAAPVAPAQPAANGTFGAPSNGPRRANLHTALTDHYKT